MWATNILPSSTAYIELALSLGLKNNVIRKSFFRVYDNNLFVLRDFHHTVSGNRFCNVSKCFGKLTNSFETVS